MDKTREDKERQQRSGNRGVYVAPRLKVFGLVGALTQSGTTGQVEVGPNPASKKA